MERLGRTWAAREAGRDAVVAALAQAISTTTAPTRAPSPAATAAGGLFPGQPFRGRTFLLRVQHSGNAEFRPSYTMVGTGPVQALAHFPLNRSEDLEYSSLPLPAAEMVAFGAVDDVIRGRLPDLPRPYRSPQSAMTMRAILPRLEVRALEDTLGAFRAHQRDYIVRGDDASSEPDTGVRP